MAFTFEHQDRQENWLIQRRGGPVIATAIHAGHDLRAELMPYICADDGDRRRDEDPMTGQWATVGDDVFCCYNSRFEVDLNRARSKAFSTDPKDTWGERIWRERPDDALVERSLRQHDAFYALMSPWIESLIRRHRRVLLLDIHSYNHRRGGAASEPADPKNNPDIDLGVTTLDRARFGTVAERLQQELARGSHEGRPIDVRCNVRYPDGGHFPEWVFANYGDEVCTITLEYKKIYMDEWSGAVWLPTVDALHQGLRRATEVARAELKQCG